MNTRIGLLGIFGIWLTMAMMPLAELMQLNANQLLVLRGLPAVVILGLAATIPRYRISMPDRNTILFAFFFVVACLGLFQGIKAWGASLSAVLLDMAVLVNFFFAAVRKEKIGVANLMLFGTAIAGSFLALRAWDAGNINVTGLLWSLVALVANGLGIEYGSRAQQDNQTKAFWQSVALSTVGFAFSGTSPLDIRSHWLMALVFGISTGLLNFLSAFVAFKNLKPTWTGTLVLGVTPWILIGSWFITGKILGLDQMLGVGVVICSVGTLAYLLGKKKSPKMA